MFIPPNPNDRPLRQRQFAILQLVVLMILACVWSAGVRIAIHPETPRGVREFLGVVLMISGGAMALYGVIFVIRYFLLRKPP